MTPVKMMILVCLAGTSLMVVGASKCELSPLYPYDLTNWHMDHYEIIYGSMYPPLNFYGSTYDWWFINPQGVMYFTNSYVDYYDQLPTSEPFAVILWNELDMGAGTGCFFFKGVDVNWDLDIVGQFKKDTEALGVEAFEPENIFIITWSKELCASSSKYDKSNTLQIVVGHNWENTTLIFNYGSINWANSSNALRFNLGDEVTMVEYPISYTSDMSRISGYTNVGVPGRIVTRVEGDIQVQDLTDLSDDCSVCSFDQDNDKIITFDGSDNLNVTGDNKKFLLSKEYQEGDNKEDQCKYMLKIITDENGAIDWVSMSFGVHPRKPTKYKRNIVFGRHQNTSVQTRGHGGKGDIEYFPHTEYIDGYDQEIFVLVEQTENGWVIRSPSCQYFLTYNPSGESQELSLALGPYYVDKTFGICQNNNGDPADDNKACTKPPQEEEPSEIVESCSCSVKDKRCNNKLTHM